MYDIRNAIITKIKFGDIISMIKDHDKMRNTNTVDISEKLTNKLTTNISVLTVNGARLTFK